MNHSFLKQTVRDNWYLFTAFVVILVAIPLFAMRNNAGGESDDVSNLARAHVNSSGSALGGVNAAAATPKEIAQARARQTIAEHRERFEADPKSAEAPSLLSAMGNLYRQKLGDYQQAASCFEQLLRDYPNDSSARDAYLQLVVCYERLGDQENRSRVLRLMMDRYPSDSSEYGYAAQELGIVQ